MAESTAAGNMEGGYTNTGAKPGPVLIMMSKRLRALRKKYTKIVQIEEAKNQGKVVNKEQEEVLKSKFSVATLIDEYEKLQKPLEAAVKEELLEREKDLAAAAAIQRSAVSAAAVTSEENSDTSESKDAGEMKDSTGIVDGGSVLEEEKISGSSHEDIADLLKLLYFAHLFDVRSQGEAHSLVWTKEYERSSCISYDYVTEEAETPLGEQDLDAIAALGTLLTSRPPNVTLSHKDALQRCVDHAKNWLSGSNEEIGEGSKVSYDHLRERLNKILSSDYFTVTPELQTAAAAAGQYVSDGNIEIAAQSVVAAEEPPTYYAPQEQAGPPLQFYQQHADYMAGGPAHTFTNDGQGDYPAGDSTEYAVIEEPQQDGQPPEGGAHFQQQAQLMPPHLSGQPQQTGAPPQMMSVPHQMMGGAPQYISGGPGPRGGGMGGGPRGGRGGYRGRGGGYDNNRGGGGRRGGARGNGRGMQGGMQYYEPQGYAGGMGGGRGSGRGHRGGMRGGRGGGPAGGPE